jgi:hypothetical protein
MTKQMMTKSAIAGECPSEAKSESGFPERKKFIGVAQGLALAGNEFASPAQADDDAWRGRFSAAQAAAVAGKQLVELVRLPLDSVSAVTRTESGWQVIVNLVELSRIPHSMDVISSYAVTLGEDGSLDGYRRMTRYKRDQLGDDS